MASALASRCVARQLSFGSGTDSRGVRLVGVYGISRWAASCTDEGVGEHQSPASRLAAHAHIRELTDLEPAWDELRRLAQEGQRVLPLLALALVVFFITWLVAALVARLARLVFRKRVTSPLLLTVIARAFAILIVVLGLYLILQVVGLTRLALTVLGGTGLLGLVLGFAFRDSAENFLASLLLSIRNPFNMGDLVRIGDDEGIVRNLNTRSTLLFTLDGNHVQIPNATAYKSVIATTARARVAGATSPSASATTIPRAPHRQSSVASSQPIRRSRTIQHRWSWSTSLPPPRSISGSTSGSTARPTRPSS